ncbi:hypothetical protein E2F43_02835 [Seongchinamella unica]|uniref:Uncharacterized protein n=1 Tax=Seongchinamella unica TaxID=2547392 RepID=A0A4R5LV28_9GAMM|nr:hypothetical protein [Seongchinamella unica]TDG15187.1 hypothetical protein E2F43_02835 [Seongchinamella unica]
MSIARTLLAISAAGVLVACAGTPGSDGVASNEAPAEPGSKEEIVCEYQQVVGSHFKKRICMSRGERDSLREDTQDAMRTVSKSGPSTAN